MPYLSIQTNQDIDEDQTKEILRNISKATSEILGKPESYVMVTIQSNATMLFAGNDDPLAYVQLRSLGLSESSTTNLSHSICSLVSSEFKISSERIYIDFASPDRHMWGWNNKTF